MAQRVLAAQRQLETSDRSVERVAEDCGFGAAATLRLHFNRIVGVAPTAYRQTFRQAPVASGPPPALIPPAVVRSGTATAPQFPAAS
ncbi:MAG: helix-turn-helix domain-containing protein [Chloroflexota bacterium]